jgi:hypothetical protein
MTPWYLTTNKMKIEALTFQLLDYLSKIDQSDQNVIRVTSIEPTLHY